MTPRAQLRRHLEAHLQLHTLPQEVPPALEQTRGGVAPFALRLVREWRDGAGALAHLRPLLDAPAEPDPLMEPLLRWGERLAGEAGDDVLRARFSRALARYRERFTAAHALDTLAGALTDWALSDAAELRPYAAADTAPGPVELTLLRLRDPVSARFDATTARLSELDAGSADYREIVLELDPADRGWLDALDPRELTLRFVLEDRFVQVSTRDGELFDVEVNRSEARVYAKVRGAPPRWEAVESIVIMAPTPAQR